MSSCPRWWRHNTITWSLTIMPPRLRQTPPQLLPVSQVTRHHNPSTCPHARALLSRAMTKSVTSTRTWRHRRSARASASTCRLMTLTTKRNGNAESGNERRVSELIASFPVDFGIPPRLFWESLEIVLGRLCSCGCYNSRLSLVNVPRVNNRRRSYPDLVPPLRRKFLSGSTLLFVLRKSVNFLFCWRLGYRSAVLCTTAHRLRTFWLVLAWLRCDSVRKCEASVGTQRRALFLSPVESETGLVMCQNKRWFSLETILCVC